MGSRQAGYAGAGHCERRTRIIPALLFNDLRADPNGTDITISHCGYTPYARCLGRAASRAAELHGSDGPDYGHFPERAESHQEADRERCVAQVLHKKTITLVSVPFRADPKRRHG